MIAKSELGKPVEIYCSYADVDEVLLQELEKHLALLRWHGLIRIWHRGNMVAGADWQHEIDDHLDSAHIILLLISPNFLISGYCYGIEARRAPFLTWLPFIENKSCMRKRNLFTNRCLLLMRRYSILRPSKLLWI